MWKHQKVEVIKTLTIQGYFQQGEDSILIAEIPILVYRTSAFIIEYRNEIVYSDKSRMPHAKIDIFAQV